MRAATCDVSIIAVDRRSSFYWIRGTNGPLRIDGLRADVIQCDYSQCEITCVRKALLGFDLTEREPAPTRVYNKFKSNNP